MENKHLFLNAKNCRNQSIVKVQVCVTFYPSDFFDDDYKNGTFFAVEDFLNPYDDGAGTANVNYLSKLEAARQNLEDPRKSDLLSGIKTLEFHFKYEGVYYSCSYISRQDRDYKSVRIGNGNLINKIDESSFVDLVFEY